MPSESSPDLRTWRPHWRLLAAVVAIAIAIPAVPLLAHLPARLIAACGGWLAIAGVLELLSMLGFVLAFKLVFGARMSWRRAVPAGLRGLAASTVLPAGGLIGPAAAARVERSENASLDVVTRSAIAFALLISAPGVLVLAGLGLMLWAGWLSGPHEAVLTLLPAAVAAALTAATWLISQSSTPSRSWSESTAPSSASKGSGDTGIRSIRGASNTGVRAIRGGAAEARRLLGGSSWQLGGALAYYVFDNAVLWAAFHAYGRPPALSVVMMGYLVGSFVGSLPLPAGLGVVEGGMIGALVLYGSPAAPAAAAVLLYRAISLSFPVIPGALSWRAVPRRHSQRGREPGGEVCRAG
jgi:uncharacterized membrane protein YbhN (UPF0104 family)